MNILASRARRVARFAGLAMLAAMAFTLAAPARAAEYPSRPVMLVVAFTPGGPSDVLARIVGKQMEQLLGVPFIIENRPGAGGNIAADSVAHAASDGYTLLMGNNSILATNESLYKRLTYSPQKDFLPVTLIGTQANILVVNPSVPANSLQELIALAIDEEDQAQSATEEEARRGRPHAGMSIYDVSDYANVKPLSLFDVSELDSPFARMPGARFGAHQFHERMTGTLVHAVWFSAGLRIVDIADPMAPREVGCFIPDPVDGRSAPQSNDVMLDARGLIYMVDRHVGFDVLEFAGA